MAVQIPTQTESFIKTAPGGRVHPKWTFYGLTWPCCPGPHSFFYFITDELCAYFECHMTQPCWGWLSRMWAIRPFWTSWLSLLLWWIEIKGFIVRNGHETKSARHAAAALCEHVFKFGFILNEMAYINSMTKCDVIFPSVHNETSSEWRQEKAEDCTFYFPFFSLSFLLLADWLLMQTGAQPCFTAIYSSFCFASLQHS